MSFPAPLSPAHPGFEQHHRQASPLQWRLPQIQPRQTVSYHGMQLPDNSVGNVADGMSCVCGSVRVCEVVRVLEMPLSAPVGVLAVVDVHKDPEVAPIKDTKSSDEQLLKEAEEYLKNVPS